MEPRQGERKSLWTAMANEMEIEKVMQGARRRSHLRPSPLCPLCPCTLSFSHSSLVHSSRSLARSLSLFFSLSCLPSASFCFVLLPSTAFSFSPSLSLPGPARIHPFLFFSFPSYFLLVPLPPFKISFARTLMEKHCSPCL